VPILTARRLLEGVHRFVRRHLQRALRVRQKLRFREETFHLILAGVVGVMGGLVNIVFYYAMESMRRYVPGNPLEVGEIMSTWGRVLTPTLGGLGAGLVLHWGLRLVGPQGSGNLLEVVVAGDGRLPLRTGLVKTVSSVFSIGSGASIGREGAITQLAATFASKIGQVAHWAPYRLRLLVGCGAASGIAAAYNAPISGAVFASLIVLGNFSMSHFAPLVFASVVATMVSRSFFGIKPWYEVPPFEFTSATQLPWFVLLGIVAGLLGSAFLKMLSRTEILFQKVRLPIYGKLAFSGLLVGLIAIHHPGVWGNGYIMTNRLLKEDFLSEHFPLIFLGGLFLAKLLATVFTVGSGAVGGVFTPTLFLGAGLGAIQFVILRDLGRSGDLPGAVFALVGMGSMLAATTHSPLLAMIMILEISHDYSLMPALMLGCVVSTLVSRRFHSESIYTEPLRLKGLTTASETTEPGTATEKTVGDLMLAPVQPVRESASLGEIGDRFLTTPNNFIPVVDGLNKLLGMVALQDLKQQLATGEDFVGIIAYDVMRPPPACVTPNQRLLDVLPVALASEQRNIPVVNSLKDNRLVGSLPRAEVLGLFAEAIAASNRTSVPAPPVADRDDKPDGEGSLAANQSEQ
jgi:CIC family chloride channel protein